MKEKKKKSVVSIICIVLIALMLPVIVVNFTLAIKGMIAKDQVPSFLGISPLAVETNSMEPLFSGGDLIIVKQVDTGELKYDDVISFYDPSKSDHSVVVTHRIVGIVFNDDGTRSFQTKGDANNVNDSSQVPESEVVGKYLFKLSGLGSFVMFLSTTNGVLLCVVLPLIVLFGIDYLIRFIDERKKKKQTDIETIK